MGSGNPRLQVLSPLPGTCSNSLVLRAKAFVGFVPVVHYASHVGPEGGG